MRTSRDIGNTRRSALPDLPPRCGMLLAIFGPTVSRPADQPTSPSFQQTHDVLQIKVLLHFHRLFICEALFLALGHQMFDVPLEIVRKMIIEDALGCGAATNH